MGRVPEDETGMVDEGREVPALDVGKGQVWEGPVPELDKPGVLGGRVQGETGPRKGKGDYAHVERRRQDERRLGDDGGDGPDVQVREDLP